MFGRPIIGKTVFFILLPMAIIKLKREQLGQYGINFDNLWYHLKIGLKSLVIIYLVDCTFPLLDALDMSYRHWDGAAVLSLVHVVGLVLLARFLKAERTHCPQAASGPRIGVFLLILIGLTVISALTLPLGKQVGDFTYGLFTIGFGEEIFFRGYIQSRLNRSFGRSFCIWGVHWGWGLIITSIVFGLAHYLHGGGTLWWGMWTVFAGLLFGFLREKTGGIVAPAIAHGVPAALVYLILGGID